MRLRVESELSDWFEVCACGFKQTHIGFLEVAVGSRAEDFLETYGSFNHGWSPKSFVSFFFHLFGNVSEAFYASASPDAVDRAVGAYFSWEKRFRWCLNAWSYEGYTLFVVR